MYFCLPCSLYKKHSEEKPVAVVGSLRKWNHDARVKWLHGTSEVSQSRHYCVYLCSITLLCSNTILFLCCFERLKFLVLLPGCRFNVGVIHHLNTIANRHTTNYTDYTDSQCEGGNVVCTGVLELVKLHLKAPIFAKSYNVKIDVYIKAPYSIKLVCMGRC